MTKICVCGHSEDQHGHAGPYDNACQVWSARTGTCHCNDFNEVVEVVTNPVVDMADTRPIYERMRITGVRLGDLIHAMCNNPEALVSTLNGLYFLDLGNAEPEMEEGFEVWDGAFEYHTYEARGWIVYVGSAGPSGKGPQRIMTLNDNTLIFLR